MEIAVENRQTRIPLRLAAIRKIIKRILKYEGIRKARIGCVFVSALQIMALNKKFLKKNYVTDVLSFDLKEWKRRPDRSFDLTGEIVICPEAAQENAKVFKTSLEEEIILYIIHGILHLLGYDDHRRRDIRRMRQREKEIMKRLL